MYYDITDLMAFLIWVNFAIGAGLLVGIFIFYKKFKSRIELILSIKKITREEVLFRQMILDPWCKEMAKYSFSPNITELHHIQEMRKDFIHALFNDSEFINAMGLLLKKVKV